MPASVHQRAVGLGGLGSPATQLMRAVRRNHRAEMGTQVAAQCTWHQEIETRMWSNISRGANSAAQAAIVGALAFVFLDQLMKWISFGLSIGSLWIELEALALLCGTALAATLPFAMGGGSLLGAMASRFGRAHSFLAIGVALGIVAMLGGFAVVYCGAVCVSSHGLCYQDPVGWIDWGIQRDFLSGNLVYPRRMALSTLFGAIGGGWAARRIVTTGLLPAKTQASA